MKPKPFRQAENAISHYLHILSEFELYVLSIHHKFLPDRCDILIGQGLLLQ